MSKITLNFFDEELIIDKPQSLSFLRSKISELFGLSLDDATEIILSYKDENDNISISTEEDLKIFLESKNEKKINLSISQESKLFKENLQRMQNDMNDKKELARLYKERGELKKMKKEKSEAAKKKINEIQNQINQLTLARAKLYYETEVEVGQIKVALTKNEEKIFELKKKMGLPFKKPIIKPSNNPKIVINFGNLMKINDKGLNTELKLNKDEPYIDIVKKEEIKELIHLGVKCDGCKMYPIIGKRYKCNKCFNFDFCEKCYEENKSTHQHEFTITAPKKK